MRSRQHVGFALWVAGLALWACDAPAPPESSIDGPSVAVNVAALNLTGVGDVVWDVEVVNGRTSPGPEVVWQRRLSSTGYGDGAGSASYVGPCDADPAVSENTVKVWVVGVYSGPVTALGVFASGAVGGAMGPSVPFENPTTVAAPLTRKVTCLENADVGVQFDVALMRPAQQGFFDIAVNFNNIFCSAKFDCCVEEGGSCARDLALLFDAGGQRSSTMVLGFACTAGANAAVETELYLDPLELDCTAPSNFTTGFAADLVIDPSGAGGNQCVAGSVDGCGPRVTSPVVDADNYLYQVGLYRSLEQLTSGGVVAREVYWNGALGVVRKAGGSVGIEDCWLRTRGTADDAQVARGVDGGAIEAGTVYPYVQWQVKLGSCMAEPLTFGSSTAMVRTEYTKTTDPKTSFAYGYGPSMPAGPYVCGLLGAGCPAGFACNTALAAGTSYAAFCVSDGSVPAFGPADAKVFVPAGTFWMGCSPSDPTCAPAGWRPEEKPQHLVALSAYAIDRTAVTAAAYKVCATTAGSGCTMPSDSSPTSTDGTYGPPAKQDHPINFVNWSQAAAYCAWKGDRLCTEAEWERAARGGCETLSGNCQTTARIFPWGNTSVTCAKANVSGCEPVTQTASAGGRPAGASPYGALNLAGNVYEWTADWHGAYPASEPLPNPTGPASGSGRVVRGGFFVHGDSEVRASARSNYAPSNANLAIGFRCCRPVP